MVVVVFGHFEGHRTGHHDGGGESGGGRVVVVAIAIGGDRGKCCLEGT